MSTTSPRKPQITTPFIKIYVIIFNTSNPTRILFVCNCKSWNAIGNRPKVERPPAPMISPYDFTQGMKQSETNGM